jgi:phospho-N-acetylmuramoyl-pentapeptide-transferase
MHWLNVIRYTSFRMMASLITALFLFFCFGSWFIRNSKTWFAAKSREYTPETHRAKDGIPTMGGLLVIVIVVVTTLLWCKLDQLDVWLFLGSLVGFGAIGLWDDWSKICYKKGIKERDKFLAQCIVSLVLVTVWFVFDPPSTAVCLPFLKQVAPHLGVLFIPWVLFLLIGSSNAVNITDGLDGLATSLLIANFATFTILVYLSGHSLIAAYLNIPFTDHAEIAIIGTTLMGSLLGFLWYNAYPAQIFMGDVGALAFGSSLALMALFAKQELLLAVTGGIFVIETLSVIIQVGSHKLRGKRVFKMAPIHHHFELIGWPEPKITIRFTIITIVLCVLALMTIKIR